MRKLFRLAILIFAMGIIAIGCTKEGPAGKDGADGQDGADGTAGCIVCHAPDVVDLVATQYAFSKHEYGEAAFEESGNVSCTPCHASEAFKYVCENNISSAFNLNPTTNKYVNGYVTIPSAAYGEINCSTCHNELHQTYTVADSGLTWTSPVSLTMWGGAKEANLTADGGISNLCVKCHQPRPLTASAGDGNVIDYAGLASNPGGTFYDPDGTSNKLKPGYRTHVHYGVAGAVFAGVGGVEFAGVPYENSAHTAIASCQDCHMAEITGRAGGHTFFAEGNFNGCNAAGCHTDLDASSENFWVNPRASIKEGLDELAAALQINGINIMNMNPNSEENLWYANTSDHFDGYLNIYDPINNPEGIDNNPAGSFRNPSPSNSWTQEQKDFNQTLPTITLTNAQMGAIINFQFCLRDYSLGIHNFNYTNALLTNSKDVLADFAVAN